MTIHLFIVLSFWLNNTSRGKNEKNDIGKSKKIMKLKCLFNLTEAERHFNWKYLCNDNLSVHIWTKANKLMSEYKCTYLDKS